MTPAAKAPAAGANTTPGDSGSTPPGPGPTPGGSSAAHRSPGASSTPGRPLSQELGVQIIGMSATLCNADAVAQWLGAALYVTDWRPIPLQQMLKVGNQLLDVEGRVVRTLEVPPGWDKEEGLALLCKETVEVGAARAHTRRLVGQDTDCAWCVM